MCSKMEGERSPEKYIFVDPDWIKTLIREYEEEVKAQHTWTPLLLRSSCRKILWRMCNLLGVGIKGIPASACLLMERYLSRHIRSFLQVPRGSEEWERYKNMLSSRFYLATGSCIQLASKMVDQLAPVTPAKMSSTLLKLGIEHTKTEIIEMEHHVFSTLDFRIPLWTSLDIAEFLAVQMGFTSGLFLEAVEHVLNLTEYNRDQVELHIHCYDDIDNRPGPSTAGDLPPAFQGTCKSTMHNLHMCAGVVSAATRYVNRSEPDTIERLATLTRANLTYITILSDVIVTQIIPTKKHIPTILKKRRLH